MSEFNSDKKNGQKMDRKRTTADCKKREIGQIGERIALRYLRAKNYEILGKNFSIRLKKGLQLGEIDLIAKKGKKIIFIEVKSQTKEGFIRPEERVNFKKRERIRKIAEAWLDRHKYQNVEWQIDVISVFLDFLKRRAKIVHFKNI
jgi:putative endonuclease